MGTVYRRGKEEQGQRRCGRGQEIRPVQLDRHRHIIRGLVGQSCPIAEDGAPRRSFKKQGTRNNQVCILGTFLWLQDVEQTGAGKVRGWETSSEALAEA